MDLLVVAQKIETFFADFPRRQYQPGQILIQAQDNPEYVFYVVEGRIKQYDISERGDEVVLNTFKSPAFFPMSYAITKQPNEYFYEAEVETTAHIAPPAEVVAFIRANPDVMYDLLSRVYQGLDGLLGRLAHMMAGSARGRVLYELLIEGRRFGEERGHGVMLTLTETDLAIHAGLARETVSREIGKLKAEGLVSVIKNEMFVNSLDRLAEVVSKEL
ncbi:MAG TPA: Crp/Fnr family transcriptional regulator [Candidatus Saccharimonadia bacterium]|nr:Crp/Fnr family transcriptional regulator [Candidatus Saccharimonadia bacterium]